MGSGLDPRTGKYVKGYEFLSFTRNFPNKWIKLLHKDRCFKKCLQKSSP